MAHTTKEQLSKTEWETAIANFGERNFLQSANWGEFQEKMGRQVVRVVIVDQQNVTRGFFQGVIEKAKRGTFLTIAGGPIFNWSNAELRAEIFGQMKKIAKEKGCSFVRFRPQVEQSVVDPNWLKQPGCVKAPMHVTADLTLQLDISLPEEQILAQMDKDHRYSINKAKRDGVTTSVSTDPQEIKSFYDQQLALATKHGFVPFSYRFLFEQFGVFVRENQAALIHSFLGDQLLASAFVIFYNHEAVYHYGVSTDNNRNSNGSYATQWAAILEAKARGCLIYNFWGVSPLGQKNHRFSGVSLFKRGFGGKEVAYLPAHDIPLSPLYWVTYLFETLRKKLRRL